MSLTAAVIRELVGAGLDGDRLVAACERIEEAETPVRSSNAERQARYRARLKNAARNGVTSNVTRNGAEASKETPHTPQETKLPPSPPTGAQTPKGVPRRGTRLPEDFVPSTEEAIAAGLEAHRVPAERAKFLDHFRAAPGQRGVKQDWPATWRNWCRRAAAETPRSTGPPTNGRQTGGDYIRAAMSRLQQHQADEPPDDLDLQAVH